MDEAQEDIQDCSQPLFSDATQDDLEIFEVVPDLGQEAGADVQMDVSEVLQADLGDGPRASSPAPDAIYVEEAVVPGQENDPVQVPVQAPVQAPVCEVPPNRRTPIPDLSPIPSFQPAQRPPTPEPPRPESPELQPAIPVQDSLDEDDLPPEPPVDLSNVPLGDFFLSEGHRLLHRTAQRAMYRSHCTFHGDRSCAVFSISCRGCGHLPVYYFCKHEMRRLDLTVCPSCHQQQWC